MECNKIGGWGAELNGEIFGPRLSLFSFPVRSKNGIENRDSEIGIENVGSALFPFPVRSKQVVPVLCPLPSYPASAGLVRICSYVCDRVEDVKSSFHTP